MSTLLTADSPDRACGSKEGPGKTRSRRHRSSSPVTRAVILVVVIGVLAGGTLVARRKGYSGLGGNTVVRCRQGHLFTTIWIPGASLKSIRFGWARFQRCPVGKHWSVVVPVKEAELTDEEKNFAFTHRDVRIP
jgi:hypothetical protein